MAGEIAFHSCVEISVLILACRPLKKQFPDQRLGPSEIWSIREIVDDDKDVKQRLQLRFLGSADHILLRLNDTLEVGWVVGLEQELLPVVVLP